MKNSLLTILFALIFFTVNAQTEAGKKLIGGNAGFSISKDKVKVGNTSRDQFVNRSSYINPNLALFIMDQFALGGKMNLGSYTTIIKDQLILPNGDREDGKSNTFQFTIGPWARYYFPLGTKSAVFVDGNVGFGLESNKQKDVRSGRVVTVNDPTRGVLQMGIGPGYTYFITESVGLEGLLQLRYDRSGYKRDGSDDRIVNSNVGMFFNIGLQVYF